MSAQVSCQACGGSGHHMPPIGVSPVMIQGLPHYPATVCGRCNSSGLEPYCNACNNTGVVHSSVPIQAGNVSWSTPKVTQCRSCPRGRHVAVAM